MDKKLNEPIDARIERRKPSMLVPNLYFRYNNAIMCDPQPALNFALMNVELGLIDQIWQA